MSIIETVNEATNTMLIRIKPRWVIWTPKLAPIVESVPVFKFSKKIPVSSIASTKMKSFWGQKSARDVKLSWLREGLVYSAEEGDEVFDKLTELRQSVESSGLPAKVKKAFNTWSDKDSKTKQIDFVISIPEDDQAALVDLVQRALLDEVTFTLDEEGVLLSKVTLRSKPSPGADNAEGEGTEGPKKKRRVEIITPVAVLDDKNETGAE